MTINFVIHWTLYKKIMTQIDWTKWRKYGKGNEFTRGSTMTLTFNLEIYLIQHLLY